MDQNPYDDGQPIIFEHGNRKLELIVDVPAMRRLRHYSPPIDIRYMLDQDDPDGGLIGRLLDDPGAVVDIAYEATRHCTEGPETPEQFAEGIHGDKLDELTHKVLKACARFTPDPRARTAIFAILEKTKQAGDRVRTEALSIIQGGKLDAVIQEAIQDLNASTRAPLTDGSTSSPSSAGSTPKPSKGGRSGGSKKSTDDEK